MEWPEVRPLRAPGPAPTRALPVRPPWASCPGKVASPLSGPRTTRGSVMKPSQFWLMETNRAGGARGHDPIVDRLADFLVLFAWEIEDGLRLLMQGREDPVTGLVNADPDENRVSFLTGKGPIDINIPSHWSWEKTQWRLHRGG
jgi:hypothetical protein